jgi:hypothetical protein
MTERFTITDLYEILAAEMRDLRAGKVKPEHANALANAAQTMINAGKLEIKFIETVGGQGTGFMPKEEQLPRRESLRLVNRWKSRID